MSDIAIKVENISKLYQLGEVGTGTISKDLNRWWARVRGKEDPYTKVGQVNDRTKKVESDFVWALKEINFEVKQGEVLGIIGRNGAGKSTLLKILSKITSPTTGKIYTKGRIASLLEVGTGFHPEMTGRENIYLNGAILGMRKWEIDKKFDEIVDFAGVEAYIDTPVKRYSSGMYVRLAFAVAAFLEPEILIVDEVLAVGDAEFQKKCLGRMKDVSVNEGRTILFVSHNLAAVQNLSSTAILLGNGRKEKEGEIAEVINFYIESNSIKKADFEFSFNKKIVEKNIAFIKRIVISNCDGEVTNELKIGMFWKVQIFFHVATSIEGLVVGLGITDSYETPIRTCWTSQKNLTPGEYLSTFIEDKIIFNVGRYKLLASISVKGHTLEYIDSNIYLNFSDAIHDLNSNIGFRYRSGVLLNHMKTNVEKII